MSHFPAVPGISWPALMLSSQHFRCLLSPLTFLISTQSLECSKTSKQTNKTPQSLECSNVTDGRLALYRPGMRGRRWLPLRASQLPPATPAFLPNPNTSLQPRLLCRNVSNFTVNDKNHEVYPATSGESLELSCLLLIIFLHIQIYFCFSQVRAYLRNFLLDFNAQ